jgi:hypothetical protein
MTIAFILVVVCLLLAVCCKCAPPARKQQSSGLHNVNSRPVLVGEVPLERCAAILSSSCKQAHV